MALRSYLATEVALDHADGLLTRREALRRLGTLGLSAVAASGLLSACADAAPAPAAAPTPAAAAPDYDVAAATARTEAVTFPGGTGSMSGAFAAAQSPRGARRKTRLSSAPDSQAPPALRVWPSAVGPSI